MLGGCHRTDQSVDGHHPDMPVDRCISGTTPNSPRQPQVEETSRSRWTQDRHHRGMASAIDDSPVRVLVLRSESVGSALVGVGASRSCYCSTRARTPGANSRKNPTTRSINCAIDG